MVGRRQRHETCCYMFYYASAFDQDLGWCVDDDVSLPESTPKPEEMYNQIAAWYNEPKNAAVARNLGRVSGTRARIPDMARLRRGDQTPRCARPRSRLS